jgi:hypothetical protein
MTYFKLAPIKFIWAETASELWDCVRGKKFFLIETHNLQSPQTPFLVQATYLERDILTKKFFKIIPLNHRLGTN